MRLRAGGAAPRRPGGRASAQAALRLDHLVVRARTLEEGAAWVEEALGVPLGPGGRHEAMGTHNRLLSLGPDEYLEVIAVDPGAPEPCRARWFGLDGFDGPPALGAWVARTPDLDGAIRALPAGMGEPLDLARDALRWRFAAPPPGACPALIEWAAEPPAAGLPDRGCRLRRLEIRGPDALAVRDALAPHWKADARILFGQGDPPAITAVFETPSGRRMLRPSEP